MKESEVAFFRPLWIRILVTGVLAVWLGFEALFTHDSFWMTIIGAALAYCIWLLFINFPKRVPEVPPDDEAGTP
ncbi:MAG: DUF3329 domain-containing protein [Devosia sp.]